MSSDLEGGVRSTETEFEEALLVDAGFAKIEDHWQYGHIWLKNFDGRWNFCEVSSSRWVYRDSLGDAIVGVVEANLRLKVMSALGGYGP